MDKRKRQKDKFGESYCSKCYVYAVIDEDGRERKSKYCPHCGAQMFKGVKIPVISMEDVSKIMEEMEK